MSLTVELTKKINLVCESISLHLLATTNEIIKSPDKFSYPVNRKITKFTANKSRAKRP